MLTASAIWNTGMSVPTEESRFKGVWRSFVERCTNPKHSRWHQYGGRGITVCDRWMQFENFKADMWPRPLGSQIDRIDNDSGYSPDNCRWATVRQNANNTRRNKHVVYSGERFTYAEFARKIGVNDDLVREKAASGMSGDQIAEFTSQLASLTVQQRRRWAALKYSIPISQLLDWDPREKERRRRLRNKIARAPKIQRGDVLKIPFL